MIADVLSDATARMDRAVEAAKEDFATVRTGRANPQLFQKILVTTTARPTPLAQLASLQNPEARTLVVTPYDKSRAEGDRAGDPRHPEPRREPDERRQHRPRHAARADRGAPQGVRQARARQGRGREGARAQHPSQVQGRPRRPQERGRRGRARPRREGARALTRRHVDAIDDALKRKEAELLEV